MKNLNTGAIPKKTQFIKVQSDSSVSFPDVIPEKNVNTGAKPKKLQSIEEHPYSSGPFLEKNLNTGAKPKKTLSIKVQPDLPGSPLEVMKKIRTCFITEKDEGNYVKKGLPQARASEIPHPPEKEILDYRFSKPSTSTSGFSADEIYPTPEEVLDYHFGQPSTSTSDFWHASEDPQSSGPSTSYPLENVEDLLKFNEIFGLPANLFDSSDDETSGLTSAEIRDIYYSGPLTKEQQEKEDRMTKIFLEQGENSWEFCGKGSSDFDIPPWTPSEQPPLSALGIRLDNLEKAAKKKFSKVPEVITIDSD